jgi:hypothetical protein
MNKLLRIARIVGVSRLVVLFLLVGGSVRPASAQVITYSVNTTLTADVFCADLAIKSGVILTTNGFNIYCTGTVINEGTIQTGLVGNGGTGANESPTGATAGGTYPNSYGGSGGGGGGSAAVNLGPAQISGSGGNTLVSGGSGGTELGGSCGTGGAGTAGSRPGRPSITNTLIQTWYGQGISTFLAGGGGGGGAGSGNLCSDTGGSAGGSGAFGIYIQAKKIVAGAINASGQNGGTGGSGGGGGGGGGTIILAYGSEEHVRGIYNTNGGVGGAPGPNGGAGGNGGSGQVLTFSYGTNPPVSIPPFTGIKNDISFNSLAVETPLSPQCPSALLPFSNLTCFSIQQNFYLSAPSSPAIPAYWAQNALLVWQTFAGGWVVAHEFYLWTSDPSGNTKYGTLLACSPGLPSYDKSTGIWSCIGQGFLGRALQPGSELVTTLSQTSSETSLTFVASTGQTLLQQFSYPLPLGSSILAAANMQQGNQLSNTLEPELMLVGWGNGATAVFQTGTLGTVSAYFQSAQSRQLAGSQYPNGYACKATGESSSGLLWTVPVGGPMATFGTADTNASGVMAQGIIFVPVAGVDLSSCQP